MTSIDTTDTVHLDRSGHRTRMPSTEAVATVIVGAIVFLIAVRPAVDNDLWFHLRTADWMLEHHRWVGADPFTHTRPYVTRVQTDWLAQLGYYAIWSVAGLLGVALAVATLATGSMVVLFRTLSGSTLVRSVVVILTAAASSIFWSARPQMVTFVGTVLVAAILRRWRLDLHRPSLWWLVPIFAIWVNAHGGVVYGVLILGGTLVGEVVKRIVGIDPLRRIAIRYLGVVTAACLAVLVINPSGWRVYGLPFHQVASSTQFVQEYQPPSLGDATALPFFLLLLVTVGLMAWRWRDVDPVEVILVAMGAFFALQFTRSIPFFAVLAAPALARHLSALRREQAGGRPLVDRRPADALLCGTALLLSLVVLISTFARLDPSATDERVAASFPVGATEWLEHTHPPGELFNTFDWGGYLMWRAPDYRVSVDGRTDVYDDYLETYDHTIRAQPGWEGELDREGVSTVLLEQGLPLADALRRAPGWHLAYEDAVAVAFTRSG